MPVKLKKMFEATKKGRVLLLNLIKLSIQNWNSNRAWNRISLIKIFSILHQQQVI